MAFDAYCNCIRGAETLPISYVYRENEEPLDFLMAEFIDEGTDNFLMQRTLLSGTTYRVDNTTVWQIIARLTINDVAWPYIRHYEVEQDGRNAVLTLRRQCEGDASKLSLQAKANAIIHETKYTGKSRRFTFDMYVDKMMRAFSDLDETTGKMSGPNKFTALLNGITSEVVRACYSTLIDKETRLNVPEEATSYIRDYLCTIGQYDGTSTDRNVSALSSGRLSKEQWNALSDEERKAHKAKLKSNKDKKAQKKAPSNNSDPTTTKGFKRKIKALVKERDEVTAKLAELNKDTSSTANSNNA